MHLSEQKLKQILIESGLVSDEIFEKAKTEAARSGQTVINILIGWGEINESYFTELLGQYFNVPIVNLKTRELDAKVVGLLSEALAKEKRVIVFSAEGGSASGGEKKPGILRIAMEDPADLETVEYLQQKFGGEIELYLATPSDMKFAFKIYKKDIAKEFKTIIEENLAQGLAQVKEARDLERLAENVPIIAIADSIIEYAIISNASDIFFERQADSVSVRYRVDGVLRDIISIPKEIHPALIARVKILAGLKIDEHRAPQDGRFKFKIEDQAIDVRVSIMPTFYGEKSVMRLLRSSSRPLNLSDLGMSETARTIVGENIKKTHGMVLVTGPTGSGKTTTLYAILQILNQPEVSIATIEDPIEYDVTGVSQTQVNPRANITFATGLRSLMRQNPDILMVGEIRDNETAEISIHAALTGHLVLSTLHTNDALSALPRFLDLGAPAFLLASTVNVIVAQRLVRKNCIHCVQSMDTPVEVKKTIEQQLKNIFGEEKSRVTIPQLIFRGSGCDICGHSGYSGQIGIFEVFSVTSKVRDLINKSITLEELKKIAMEDGMIFMFEDGLRKVEQGTTSIEEVLRVVRE